MTHRAWFIAILPALLVTLVVFAATAQRVEPLVLADLRVSGVAVDDDSASVRRRLDTPVRVDANVLHYPDLDVVLKDGKVAILSDYWAVPCHSARIAGGRGSRGRRAPLSPMPC